MTTNTEGPNRAEIAERFEDKLIERCVPHLDANGTVNPQCVRISAVEAVEALLGELQTSAERSMLFEIAVEFVNNIDPGRIVAAALIERARESPC